MRKSSLVEVGLNELPIEMMELLRLTSRSSLNLSIISSFYSSTSSTLIDSGEAIALLERLCESVLEDYSLDLASLAISNGFCWELS